MNRSSLKVLHVRGDGDVYKRITKELDKYMVVRRNKTTHTFQELPKPHKHSMVDIMSLRERTKYFQHKNTL